MNLAVIHDSDRSSHVSDHPEQLRPRVLFDPGRLRADSSRSGIIGPPPRPKLLADRGRDDLDADPCVGARRPNYILHDAPPWAKMARFWFCMAFRLHLLSLIRAPSEMLPT